MLRLVRRIHDLVEVANEVDDAEREQDEHKRPQGCAQDKGAHPHGAVQHIHDDVVAIEATEAGHETILAAKTLIPVFGISHDTTKETT
jgi:hypothetical protein